MRVINWDDKIVEDTLAYYSSHSKGYSNTFQRNLCCAAESLVQAYYNQPIHLSDIPDAGYDFMLDDAKIDVKNHCNNINYFEYTTNSWSVAAYNGLNADYYLFTELDYNNKKIALIGYLTKEEVLNSKHLNKGEIFKSFRATSECYIIEYHQLHLIY